MLIVYIWFLREKFGPGDRMTVQRVMFDPRLPHLCLKMMEIGVEPSMIRSPWESSHRDKFVDKSYGTMLSTSLFRIPPRTT